MDDKPYIVGRGKPPKHTQFGQPGGNPNGKTSIQKKAEMRASELASELTLDLMTAIHDMVKDAGSNQERIDFIKSDTLRLIQEVQNRAHGTPKQTIETDDITNKAPKGLDAFYSSQDDASKGD